eukprot:TRINITY_DN25784_c0_g1_i2.p1 TRINITY_DN25784_c0_g1~~TRINITY_DN25784_c0_g1_i2.p1  ORF type:complete len:527 (-),score=124.25 TRINITY_DN25784_c0_g1_i2:341-1921(-)
MAAVENKNKIKYDRQLRIWGEQGQAALEKSSVCLLNCSPTGSETLKNLVLGGIGSFTIVDGLKVKNEDLGNNFFVDEQSLGQSRAKCVCSFIQELNDSVIAKFVEESPEMLVETNPSFFSQFTLVIATQMSENLLVKLDKICRQQNVVLVIARSYGLTGLVRSSVKEHNVIESKPEHSLDDLRLHKPWPELKRFVDDFDIDTRNPVEHKHIPYVIILIKLAEAWKNSHNGMLPSTSEEKRQFKSIIASKMQSSDEDNYKEAKNASWKVWSPPGISSNLNKILNDHASEVNSLSSDFWVMVAALKEFIDNEGEGESPLEGSIPDMTSSTEYYVSLQKVYQAKAEADYLAMEHRVRKILKIIGRQPESITSASIKTFCKNARKITVCRFRSLEEEFESPLTFELQKYFGDVDNNAAIFYLLLRAVDHFAMLYNRYPGVFDTELEEDVPKLKSIAMGLLSEMGLNGPCLSEDLIYEMCRFGASEIHAVAAFIGGIASQESIKLITKQFVPFTGTFIFNGIDQRSQVLGI